MEFNQFISNLSCTQKVDAKKMKECIEIFLELIFRHIEITIFSYNEKLLIFSLFTFIDFTLPTLANVRPDNERI